MNKRIVSVIRELSRTEESINIAELSEKFKVSQRTVRNDLNAINDILKSHGLDILRLEKGGLIIREASFPSVLGYVDEKDFYDYKLSKEERKKIASVLLITSPGFITLSEIADHMAVSRATVINDLDEIKAYIRKGGLEVHSHPNKGLQVEGIESDKRLFLMRLVSFSPEAASEDIVRKQISVDGETREILGKILYEQEHIHESFLNDSSFQRVTVYLEIMMNRLLRGEYIEARKRNPNSKTAMAQGIMKYVRQYCHINITEDEVQFLSELLCMSRYMKQKVSDRNLVRIQMAAREFIEAISEELGIDLNRDYEFFNNLSGHLEDSFSAAHTDFEKNPVIDEVERENPDISRAVRKRASVLSNYAGRVLSETELGYITVHVCAAIERKKNKEIAFHVILACHAGIGTSHLLQERLKKHFNFQIIDIVSSHEARKLKAGQADFVISTVPLRECELDYITVSPLLSDEDYIRVGNMIDRLRVNRHLPTREKEKKKTAKELMSRISPVIYDNVPDNALELVEKIARVVTEYFDESAELLDEEVCSPCLYQMLPPSHIQLDIKCADWRQAVRKSAEKLLELGYIEERYVDAMIRNIEENGPYIVLSKGFALPHEGVEQGTKKLGMNLIRLNPPVEFDAEERDPVEFVCCLSAVDHKSHLKAFFHLVNMLKKEEFTEELRKCRTPEEMNKVIRRIEMTSASE